MAVVCGKGVTVGSGGDGISIRGATLLSKGYEAEGLFLSIVSKCGTEMAASGSKADGCGFRSRLKNEQCQ